MKKLDYLKYALSVKAFFTNHWMVSLYALTQEAEDAWQKDPFPARLVRQAWGVSFVNATGVLEKIDDASAKEPLFTPADRLQIDSTWAANCKTPVETSVGTLIFNHISLIESFGTKIDYQVGQLKIPNLEKLIIPKLVSTPAEGVVRDPAKIYVDELEKFGASLTHQKNFMQLCAVAATPKGIVPPTGLKEFKLALDKKYEGQLTDPVKMAAYENELKAFDDAFMKDDPSYGKFSSGKIMHTARKKLYLTVGVENGFKDNNTVTPITPALIDGWPTDPERFAEMMNGIRAGSYSRGAETVNGGVAAKIVLRAASSFKIADNDCGSKLGLTRLYTKEILPSLEGRTIIDGAKQVKVEKDAPLDHYLGKVLTIRSPQYCKSPGDTICPVCAGDNLARYKTGLAIPLTEISAILLAASLKKMHTSGLSAVELDLDEVLS